MPWLAVLACALAAIGEPARADPSGAGDAQREEPADITDVKQLSLADLLDTPVDIASKKPQTARETPGIVTVITRDDIISSGARDLLDVLVLVPGFVPALDVQSVIDLGIRGQWGHEGKILLLIDGQPMNELMFSSLDLANHYPLEAIDHIEVIRGPGSAIYGGFAELAVISIITRDATSLDGVAVAASYGQLGNALGHASTSLSFGATSTAVAGLSVAGSLAIGHASNRGTYRDLSGASYALDRSSATDPMFVKLGVKYRHLHVNAIVDNYTSQTRDGLGPVLAATVRQDFGGYYLDARYELPIRDHLTLTPRFNLIRASPWRVTDASSRVFYDKTISRYTAGLALSYQPTKQLDLLAGVETYADRAHANDASAAGFTTPSGERRDIAYDTIATYAQVLINHPIANLTVGARYEHHSTVGGSLVPRIALTKMVGRFHAKLLASQAFRAPGVESISYSDGSLAPERTTVFEGEVGYELTDHNFVAINAFDITIKKPIIYDYFPATMTELYQNFDRTGTRGVEVDYRIKYPQGHVAINYSYYTASGKNEVSAYEVPGHDDVLLAFPAHKVAMSSSLKLARGLSFNPSVVVFGERFAYTTADADGNPMLGREAPTALVNLYLLYRDLLMPGLDLGVGVYDLTGARFPMLQPYNGGHLPLPGPGRELVLRLAYEHKL